MSVWAVLFAAHSAGMDARRRHLVPCLQRWWDVFFHPAGQGASEDARSSLTLTSLWRCSSREMCG